MLSDGSMGFIVGRSPVWAGDDGDGRRCWDGRSGPAMTGNRVGLMVSVTRGIR